MTLTPGQTYLDPAPPRGEGGYRAAIDSFAALVALCDRAARQELAGQTISGADAHTLWTVGTELEQLTTFFIENAVGGFVDFNRRQVAAIADVFTEPGSGQVLEEGVGDVLPAYAVVSIGGKRWLAAGGIFSYYEFHQAMSDRLTDEAWWAMTSRPAQPGWTASYIAH
jgi:hypothetical protein